MGVFRRPSKLEMKSVKRLMGVRAGSCDACLLEAVKNDAGGKFGLDVAFIL